jgi:hypothetical protein
MATEGLRAEQSRDRIELLRYHAEIEVLAMFLAIA